ncbi:MAG: NAD(P)-dependent oxidoreductase [Desulfovibrionaceae bacterium]|nr:NAD(P)-dependent oxidoreductase [Desulfovibrionaceae bacterium]
MRVFVTGGSGFIGAAAVRLLAGRGHEALALTRSLDRARQRLGDAAQLVQGDLGDMDSTARAMRGFRPEALLHLAWDGLPDYSPAASARNLTLGLGVFDLAADAGCRSIVSAGTCWEYASRRGCLAEGDALLGASPFPAAKNALRFMGEAAARHRGLGFCWLRLFFVYGPGQRRTSLVPLVMDAVRRGRRPELKSPGNRNDFIYVQDAALALVLALEKAPAGPVYNVGSGRAESVAEVARMACRAMGADCDWEPWPEAEASEDFWADTALARRDLGFVPAFDLARGLAETATQDNG